MPQNHHCKRNLIISLDEARTSLAGILTRLTTGFLSIFNRFLRGKSTASDYQTLLSLSDVSRRETIRTFDQLSERLSSSSLALVSEKEKDYSKKRKKGHTTSSKSSSASRATGSKGSKGVRVKKSKTKGGAVTPLGMATSSGVSGFLLVTFPYSARLNMIAPCVKKIRRDCKLEIGSQ